jgi:hypothetical protein
LDYQKMEFNAIIELPSCNTSNGDYNWIDYSRR